MAGQGATAKAGWPPTTTGAGRQTPTASADRPTIATWRLLVLLAAPLVIGGSVAGVIAAARPRARLLVSMPLWLPPVVAGAIVALAVAGWYIAARRTARARQDGWRAGQRSERQAYRSFVGRLDHELKNPITAIRAAVAGLRPASQDGALAATVDAQSARLAAVLAGIRKLTDLETAPIEHEDVDVAEVVTQAVNDLREHLAARGAAAREIAVELPRVPWPLAHMRGDVDLLYLAIYNLLSNAEKYSPPGSLIVVRATDDGAWITIEVADSGMGIPPGEIDTVFDELARGSAARGIPGSGLGLSLSRIIVARHAGELVLRSRVGQGTIARLRLPATPAPHAPR